MWLACNHPSLVSKDYNTDREAIESRPAPKDGDEDEELTTMFQELGVSKGKKCQLCQDEYISRFLVAAWLADTCCVVDKIDCREHFQGWSSLPKLRRTYATGQSQVAVEGEGLEFASRLGQNSQIARVAQGNRRTRRRRGRGENDSVLPVYDYAGPHRAVH